MSDISDRVIEIIVKSLGVYPDQVRMEASFHEDIGADCPSSEHLAQLAA